MSDEIVKGIVESNREFLDRLVASKGSDVIYRAHRCEKCNSVLTVQFSKVGLCQTRFAQCQNCQEINRCEFRT